MNELLSEMAAIAADAADVIMEVYKRPFEVEFKAPEDPVTEADRRANDLICERLTRTFPEVPIVAEESPPEHWAHYRKSDRVFFVDPVDGTREFVAKSGQFVVMIGLLEGDEPTHGVLYSPVTQTLWAGAKGEGAFKRLATGERQALVRAPGPALHDSRVVSSRSQPTEINRRALELLAPASTVPLGSAGLKVAAVTEGSADIYLAPEFAGCRWDSCAPEALLRAAGGIFTDARGDPIDYRATGVENNRGAVAAGSQLHPEALQRIQELFL